MAADLPTTLTSTAIVLGFASAFAWLRAATVKVTREELVARRKKEAERKGTKPNLAGVALDGWDMSETFKSQSRWNAAGATFAAFSIASQALAQIAARV